MRTPGTWIPMATRQTRRRVHPGIWAWAPACLRRSAWSRPRLIYPASGAGQDDVSLPSYAFALGGSGDNFAIYRMPPGGSAWTNIFFVSSAGKLGLGTGAPTALLHMVTTDTTTFSATQIGRPSG